MRSNLNGQMNKQRGFTSTTTKKRRIVLAVTVPESVSFFGGQLAYLIEQGYEVTVVCDHRPSEQALEGAQFHAVPMNREMSPLADLRSLWRAIKLMRSVKPDIVNAGTPKAGLIIGLAAFLCRVPARIFTSHGLRFETVKGLKRQLLIMTERISAACAHEVIVVSASLKKRLLEHRIGHADKLHMLHHGSCKGMDAELYADTAETRMRAKQLREQLGVEEGALLYGFVGRITRDKGVDTLVEAFQMVKARIPNAKLVMAGRREDADPISEQTKRLMDEDVSIIEVGYQHDLIPFYAAMDCFVLPTYREGFSNVTLEASASGKPVIAARSTGIVDAVVEGVTGLMIEAGDAFELCKHMLFVAEHPEEGRKLGMNGKLRVIRDFDPVDVMQAHESLYSMLYTKRTAKKQRHAQVGSEVQVKKLKKPKEEYQ